MADLVDTDALRETALDLEPVRADERLSNTQWARVHIVKRALFDAADEVDRLRAEMVKAVREIRASSSEAHFERERAEGYEREMSAMYAMIDNAPHSIECKRGNSGNLRVPCTCWKADVS